MNEVEAVAVEALTGPVSPTAPPPSGQTSAELSRERPWIYGLLIAPSAVVANGVIQGGVLGYLLSQQGVGPGTQSHVIGLLALPTSLYFLWSPITDFFIRRRTWLLLGGLLAAVLMGLGFHQKSLSSATTLALMLASACCAQLVVSSSGGMMGAMRSERARRVGGSFLQAGSMGLGALSVSILLWLSPRVSRDVLALAAAALIGVPVLAVAFAPAQPEITGASLRETMGRIWHEFKTTFLRWQAVPYTLCMLFPIATGAAVGLLTGAAKSYGVSGDSVAWINGLVGGLLMAAGSFMASLFPARFRAPVVYMIVALVNVAAMSILWLGPLRPLIYYAGVTAYLFTLGSGYAMFTAVVLEFLGSSGKSGSGRYSIINSLGNVPVLYMLQLDGWGGERWGVRGIAGVECVIGGIGAGLLLAYFLTWGRNVRGPEQPAAAR